MVVNAAATSGLSIVHGLPLSEEPGLGALTLPGYLREVTTRFAERESMVLHHPDGSIDSYSYADLWAISFNVARALLACGVGKETRVGVMMTNRPEWLAAFFGIGLAGGVAVTISTFSTPSELELLLKASSVSILLIEAQILKRNFVDVLTALEPAVATAPPRQLASTKFPYLNRIAAVEANAAVVGGVETWHEFLAHGDGVDPAIVQARADAVASSDDGVLFFSSGSTGKPKVVLSIHRAVALQSWRWKRIYALEDNVRCWSANGFFWSGTFCMSLGATQLRETPGWSTANLSSLRYADPKFLNGAADGGYGLGRPGPRLWQHGKFHHRDGLRERDAGGDRRCEPRGSVARRIREGSGPVNW